MIITRTPFRISFCGGGTDLPDYYKENGGCVVSTSIDKYIYITLAKSFHENLTTLKYSTVETVDDLDFVKHPIFRETLQMYDVHGYEINSTSNIPSGTGLGSSSTFTVGLIGGIRTLRNKEVSKSILAKEACDMEIGRLGEPIGKQDQYAAAFGGLNFIRFNKDDSVDVEPIALSSEEKIRMSDNLMMFYLGGTRSASKILKSYKSNTPSNSGMKKNLSELAVKLKDKLNQGDIESLGNILDEGWQIKKSLSKDVSNETIDDVYDRAISNGAIGGKLLGAGGNGFMLFYVDKENQRAVRESLSNYREFPFRFDDTGFQVVYDDEAH